MKKSIVVLSLMVGLLSTLSVKAQDFKNHLIKVGQKAPDLEFPNPDGKTLKLSDINKGTYVLLDCWASWCGPCRASNPGLVKMYNEYSKKKFKNAKKGFTVVSFSLDKDKGPWADAIKKDGLIWPYHMSDLKGWQSAASRAYGLEFIPQAFLIDPKGKILGTYGTAEEAKDDIKKYVQ